MSNGQFRSSYIATRNKRYGQLGLSNNLFNLNQNASWVQVPLDVENKIDKGFLFTGNGLQAQFSDWVDASASIYMVSTVQRASVELAFAVNGTVRDVIGSGGYIRSTSGHNEASVIVIDGFYVNEGDVVTLWCRSTGTSGTVTSPINSSCFKLISTPATVVNGPSGSYFEGFELDLGNWVNGGSGLWERATGATPSSGTGSAGAKSGAFYAYCEMSNNGFLETYALSTSYFNKLRTVNFSYQLEGANCGTLLLQYKNKFGAWVTKWSASGNQGSSYIDVSQDFSAIPEIDDVTEIRFFYSGATDFAGDCLIDDITVVSV